MRLRYENIQVMRSTCSNMIKKGQNKTKTNTKQKQTNKQTKTKIKKKETVGNVQQVYDEQIDT